MTLPALIIFQDEFQKRVFLDWLVSHISGSLPPHRYLGDVELSNRFLKFVGNDTRLNVYSEFSIFRDRIKEIYYGYDQTFNVFQSRGLGLTWAPVRIKFLDIDDQEKIAYFITGYNIRGTTNKEFYNFLIEWLS